MRIRFDAESGTPVFDKVVVTVFVDCPQPEEAKVYLELISRNASVVRVEVSEPAAGSSSGGWLRAQPMASSFYVDTVAMRSYLRNFGAVTPNSHRDDSGGDKYQVWHANITAVDVTPGTLARAARIDISSSDSQHPVGNVIGESSDGRINNLGGWLEFSCKPEFRVSRHLHGSVRIAVEVGRVEIKNLHIWAVLPQGYRGTNGHYEMSPPSERPGYVLFQDVSPTYECVREWHTLIRGRNAGRSRNSIRLKHDESVAFEFPTSSHGLRWKSVTRSYFVGLAVAVTGGFFTNTLLVYLEKGIESPGGVLAVAFVLFLICALLGWWFLRKDAQSV